MKTSLDLNGKTILVTGATGFIGANLIMRLMRGMTSGMIVSLDNMNDDYDPVLKAYRLKMIESQAAGAAQNANPFMQMQSSSVGHEFVYGSTEDRELIDSLFEVYKFDVVVHLAGPAGEAANGGHEGSDSDGAGLAGFENILEACRHSYDLAGDGSADIAMALAAQGALHGGDPSAYAKSYQGVQHLIYAAADERCEQLAAAYSKQYNIPVTGLRLATVYGPAGRPDMLYYTAAKQLAAGETVRISRNAGPETYVYIDDVIEIICDVICGGSEGDRQDGYDGAVCIGGAEESPSALIGMLAEALVEAGALPADYDAAAHLELIDDGDDAGYPAPDRDSAASLMGQTALADGLRMFARWYQEYNK